MIANVRCQNNIRKKQKHGRKRNICSTRYCQRKQQIKWKNIGIEGVCVVHYRKVMRYIQRKGLISYY